MKRSDGERTRLEHSIARMRTTLDNVEVGLRAGGPVGDVGQAVTMNATEIACQLAKLDAYELAERDGYTRRFACEHCEDTHEVYGRMCTRCPTPCQECRAGGNGPYCETTPCACPCHRGAREALNLPRRT